MYHFVPQWIKVYEDRDFSQTAVSSSCSQGWWQCSGPHSSTSQTDNVLSIAIFPLTHYYSFRSWNVSARSRAACSLSRSLSLTPELRRSISHSCAPAPTATGAPNITWIGEWCLVRCIATKRCAPTRVTASSSWRYPTSGAVFPPTSAVIPGLLSVLHLTEPPRLYSLLIIIMLQRQNFKWSKMLKITMTNDGIEMKKPPKLHWSNQWDLHHVERRVLQNKWERIMNNLKTIYLLFFWAVIYGLWPFMCRNLQLHT